MAPKLWLAALVSAAALCCTVAAPLSLSDTASPARLNIIARFKRSPTSSEEKALVTIDNTNTGLQISIEECPGSVQECTSGLSPRRKRTINGSLLLNILRGILKLFGIRIPDEIFNLLTGALDNKPGNSARGSSGGGASSTSGAGGTKGSGTTRGSGGASSTSSSGALNLQALLGG